MHALDFFIGFFFWFEPAEAPGTTAFDGTEDPDRGTKPPGG